jgi:hypothetical protein
VESDFQYDIHDSLALIHILIQLICAMFHGIIVELLQTRVFQGVVSSRHVNSYRLSSLTLSQLMLHICSVSITFSEWYQKTNKTEDTNKLTLLAFKIIAILRNTRLATFIKLLETL